MQFTGNNGVYIGNLKRKLRSVFKDASYDTLLIMNTGQQDSNFKYLTGFTSGIFEQTILIAMPDRAVLLVSRLEEETARLQAGNAIEVICVDRRTEEKELKSLIGKKLGINASFLPVSYARRISKIIGTKRLVDASPNLQIARSIKDVDEVNLIRKAVSITERAIADTLNGLEEGQTEAEVASIFEFNQAKLGAKPSFPSIVAFGANASMPHYMPGKKKLERNTGVLLDVGGVHQNYCSDISRTIIFKPDKNSKSHARLSEMIDVVKESQMLALAEMYAGNSAAAPHAAAANHIDSYKGGIYKGRFIHALGHSIGIDVHDGQTIPSGIKLAKNMVFSDEPGIYLPGFGGVRFEDDVLIGKTASFL
jgi:Xaa-Pro aminopeptidase